MTDVGTYVLVVSVPVSTTIEVGALGEQHLDSGGYTYTGSAFGSGGFGRIDRHRRVARGDHEVRHWHVDYLLCHPETALVEVQRIVDTDCECAVASQLAERGATSSPVSGFGASDCDCPSHLTRFSTVEEAATTAAAVATDHR